MTAADTLAAHGILRAAEVVELAAAAQLELAAAAVLLEKESGGGANVWGRDDVPTAGCYDKGGEVTRQNYAAYRAALARGAAGRQGCGPTQLTWTPYQDEADALGGCWDWRANCLAGLRILASLMRVRGVEGGFAAYNGTGPAAAAYGADAMTRLTRWRALLAHATEDDVPLTDDEIERIARRTADLTWLRPTGNSFGQVVQAQQILNGTEKRVSDLQSQAGELADVVTKLPGLVLTSSGPLDLDALAGRVVDLLAARLGKP